MANEAHCSGPPASCTRSGRQPPPKRPAAIVTPAPTSYRSSFKPFKVERGNCGNKQKRSASGRQPSRKLNKCASCRQCVKKLTPKYRGLPRCFSPVRRPVPGCRHPIHRTNLEAREVTWCEGVFAVLPFLPDDSGQENKHNCAWVMNGLPPNLCPNVCARRPDDLCAGPRSGPSANHEERRRGACIGVTASMRACDADWPGNNAGQLESSGKRKSAQTKRGRSPFLHSQTNSSHRRRRLRVHGGCATGWPAARCWRNAG